MKKQLLWMLATILTFCGLTAVMTSCSDDDDKSSPAMSDIERQQLEEWEVCSKPTFISGIEGEDPDFQAVVKLSGKEGRLVF